MPYQDKQKQSAAQHEHYLRNKEQYRARVKAWKLAHPEQVKAQRQREYQRKLEKKRMLIEVQQFGEDWFEKAKETILAGGTLTTNRKLQDMFWEKLHNLVQEKYPMSFVPEAEQRRSWRLKYLNKKKAHAKSTNIPNDNVSNPTESGLVESLPSMETAEDVGELQEGKRLPIDS